MFVSDRSTSVKTVVVGKLFIKINHTLIFKNIPIIWSKWNQTKKWMLYIRQLGPKYTSLWGKKLKEDGEGELN